MSITIGRFSFEGPYTNTNELKDEPGIYVIHCYRDNAYHRVDVGESREVKSRVENHDRKDCWKRNCAGVLTVSVLYTLHLTEAGRREIEQEIRGQVSTPCGVQ